MRRATAVRNRPDKARRRLFRLGRDRVEFERCFLTRRPLPVVSRLKVMANLNISERRLPQDGRISYSLGNRVVDLRISTLPTQFGESVVLRVLDRAAVNLEIES